MRRFLPFAKQFVTVTPGRHTRPPLAGSVLPQETLEYTKFRPRRSCARSEFSTYFPDAPADQSQEVLEIASGVGPGLALSEHGPCLVGGTMTLDDVSFATRFATHSGRDVTQALLDTGSPQTLIRRNVLDRMLLVAVWRAERSLLVRVSVCVGSCPARQVLSWVGECPAQQVLFWVGSLSPPLIIAIFAHTGRI